MESSILRHKSLKIQMSFRHANCISHSDMNDKEKTGFNAFEHLEQRLQEFVGQLKECRDPNERMRLLREMRIYLDEAQHLASKPPNGSTKSNGG
jgi:hypothetical protein